MSFPRPKISASNLTKITLDTEMYVDYEWWERSEMDLKTYLHSRLSIENSFESDLDKVDLVDIRTGEVRQVDGFQYMVQIYFSQTDEDFTNRTSLVDAAFCVLLANGNQPMTIREIAKRLNRDAETVLRTIGGRRIYQGIRSVPQ